MRIKKELYRIFTFLISLSLVFGSISHNFGELSNIHPETWNKSCNNSTGQGNFTLEPNNSTNQSITPINQTIINDTSPKNQSIDDILFDSISLNLFKAGLNPDVIDEAAGDSTGINRTLNQTGELPPIKVKVSLAKCLKPTSTAQSNDPHIKALAAKITQGATTKYEKAVRIFNWVRDNLDYSFYYNTKYGAVKTLKNKEGNCVDLSHLLVALSRAAGIPARYVHVTAEFASGRVCGHVFVQAYIKGKWYNMDASNNINEFNVINNWYKVTAAIKGIYTKLPF
jgi:hypothetical protein